MADVALRPAVGEERIGGPAQHVDEPGGDGQAAGIDLAAPPRSAEVADGGDRVAADRHVGDGRRPSRPVVDGPPAEYDVVLLGSRKGTRQQSGQAGHGQQ